MFLMNTSPALEGRVLGRAVYGNHGELLLAKGVELKSHYINRLRALGIARVFITDDRLDGTTGADIVDEQKRLQAIIAMDDLLGKLQSNSGLIITTQEYDDLLKLVKGFASELSDRNPALMTFVDLKTYDGYTSSHSVNVCILALMLGVKMNLSFEELSHLGLAGLLHDVGKMSVPIQILHKPGKLSSDEFSIITTHPSEGAKILHPTMEEDPLLTSVCLQHHERMDGTGYPRGLSGDKIDYLSRLISIVDVYDALTSDRVYRRALPNSAVLQGHLFRNHSAFDKDMLDLLHRVVPPYPPGSLVRLSNGESGVVISVSEGNLDKPLISRMSDDGESFTEIIDLSRKKDLTIVSSLGAGDTKN